MTNNIVIGEDNLFAMNNLLTSDEYGIGSIDLMLWDPPYNTGNTHFLYNDKFKSHQSWLDFMRGRLIVAKELMKSSASIAVHISHHELFRLGLLMDDIFGESNRVGIINWECSYAPKNDNKSIPSTTDYVLVYAKEKKKLFRGIIPRTAEMDEAYKNYDNDLDKYRSCNIAGVWSPDNLSKYKSIDNNTRSGYKYGIQNPFTNKIYYPPVGRGWRMPVKKALNHLSGWEIEYIIDNKGDCVVKEGQSMDKAIEKLKKGPWPRIYFGKSGMVAPMGKRYRNELKNEGRVLGTYWGSDELGCISLPHEIAGHNGEAKQLIKKIIGGDSVFDTPKPLRITSLLIQLLCPKDGIVLDAFAGSGTVAHAILSLNAQDPTCDRKFVLIEQNEHVKQIACERIKRVIDGNWAIETGDAIPLEGNFCEKYI